VCRWSSFSSLGLSLPHLLFAHSLLCVSQANRLAFRVLLLIAELPEIQTAIAYIMGRIVFAYLASIAGEREPFAADNSWCRRRFRQQLASSGLANRMIKVAGC
jgi:hypothetical protein